MFCLITLKRSGQASINKYPSSLPATDSSQTARSPLYPPVQAVPPYSLHLLPIPVGLLVLPCTHQCRRSPLTPSTCYRFRLDCSFSLVPTSAGGPPLLPPPATDSGWTARTPLYPPVQAVPPPLLPPPATDSSRTARTPLYQPVQAVPPPLTPSTCYRFQSDCSYSLVPASAGGPPLLPPPFFFPVLEPVKVGTCAHDRHALQQLALNVHVKHSDLT